MFILKILLIYGSIINCNGQLLSAYEQAYGPWKIQLTRNMFGKRWYLDQLPSSTDTQRSNRGSKRKNSDLDLLFPPTAERIKSDEGNIISKTVRSIPCILTLEKSGKFIIHIDDDMCFNTKSHPVATNDADSQTQLHYANTTTFSCESSANPNIDDESPDTANLHSPLRGEWYLTPNPYCVTDRHYDTLTLIAEPRIRRAHCSEGIVTEKARIELRCKLWGRYGVGAVRTKIGLKHGREMARISHGTVMVIREYENTIIVIGDIKKSSRREVLASFRGRGMLAENKVSRQMFDQDEDEEEYGSGMDFDELENEF